MDLHERLLAAFRIECREHLDYVRATFVSRDGDGLARAELDEVFRRAHSLKGAARATDLRPVETLAHRLESLLAYIRAGRLAVSEETRRLAGKLADFIEDWMAAYDHGKPVPAEAELAAEADRFLDTVSHLSEPKGAETGGASAHSLSSQPPPRSKPVAPGDEPIRVRARSLDQLLRTASSLAGAAANQSGIARRLRQFEDMLGDLDRAWRHLQTVSPDLRSRRDLINRDRAIERQAERIDKALRWFASEIAQVRSLQHKSAWAVEQLTGELRGNIRQVRLVPADSVFSGFRKMVRDLAREQGKEVDFKTVGLDVEADRQVLEALRDPVMHLLRNAMAHGLEPPKERVKAGKSPVGLLTLSFAVEGLFLEVAIDDDGRGLDFDRIVSHALSRDLITGEEVEQALPAEIARLIFTPGFSTAKQVDDLAGRGMGMSVVYEVAARLGGHVQWLPKDRPGTCFRLTVPLSVSSQRLLLVQCQDQIYALAAEAVSRLLSVSASSVKQIEGRSLVMVDGQQIPVRCLDELLGLPNCGVVLKDRKFHVAVVSSPQGPLAMAVDGLLEVTEAVVKDVGFALPHASVVAGGILRPDGQVVVVLNAYELVAKIEESEMAAGLIESERPPEARQPVILVADDSMTTRTLEKSILEAHGYKVIVAVDGLDALIQLRANPVDLVVSDVEMPRIDGFALLKELKHDKHLAHVPVVLVTSLKRQEDIERGFELGAAAYLVKQKFDQTELLETIRQIL